MPQISVIISTYNQPEWLEKCLWSYDAQSFRDFEVIIADDGSDSKTKDLIDRLKKQLSISIQHVWHEDQGFQRCVILNKATVAAKYDYLLFTDGGCLARKDLLATHAKLAKRGFFLSGSYFKMTLPVSKALIQSDIKNQSIFKLKPLISKGQPFTYKMLKLGNNDKKGQIFDSLTTTKATWNGHCSSGWKEDILAVNGHNEEMHYGGQDRELGERLMNYGIKPLQIRHRSCVLHLDHPRSYKTADSINKNKAIRAKVRKSGIYWSPNGISKSAQPPQKLATFLINLDRSPERLKFSQEEFARYNIHFERIQAIDGNDLNINDYPEAQENSAYYHTPLTINEIACYQSHIKALKEFLRTDATHAFILEDDFKFTTNPIPPIESLMAIRDWDITKLYQWKKRKLKKLQTNFTTNCHDKNQHQLYFNASTAICNTAQIFTRNAAHKFLSKDHKFTRPMDVELKYYWEYKLKICSLCPPIITEHKETQPCSTIGHLKAQRCISSKLQRLHYTFSFGCAKTVSFLNQLRYKA